MGLRSFSFKLPNAGATPTVTESRDSTVPASGWAHSHAPTKVRSRWFVGTAALGVTVIAASWFAVRTVPWFGPLVADTLRSTLGSERVTQMEELVAHVEDTVQRAASNGAARSLTDSTPEDLLTSVPDAPAVEHAWINKPADVKPMHAQVASAEDGRWQVVPARAVTDTALHRTILHPDPERAYSELFVFALDLTKLQVKAQPGTVEPRGRVQASDARTGVIPADERDQLVAAFNGGFKSEHGQFGMMVDGTVLLAPKPQSCTFAAAADGTLRIATWTSLESDAASFSWWRQTPGCMIENGVLHTGLRDANSKNWGATLEGKTVIRRSAVGLSQDARTLFVGISNSTTARALALGMQHAGAVTVAQLDVNFSYPRFLLYREDAETKVLSARGAVKGLLYENDEYLGRPSTRDFFYVTARR